MKPNKEAIELAPQVSKALKTLGWKGWKPEIGDWCIVFGDAALICRRDRDYLHTDYGLYDFRIAREEATPFLHWELIEKILEGLGYRLYHRSNYLGEMYNLGYLAAFGKAYMNKQRWEFGKTRQLATMQAVIALAKEVGK